MTFSALRVRSGSDNFTGAGSISLTTTTCTTNLVLKDNVTGKTSKVDNFIIGETIGIDYSDITLSGTFYDHDHGYVTLSTVAALRFYDDDEEPSSGGLVVEGKNSAKTNLTVLSNTTYKVVADVDADGTYEWDSGTLNWSDL